MRQYSSDEIFDSLSAKGGDAEDQAAAMVVVTQAIIEARRLGRKDRRLCSEDRRLEKGLRPITAEARSMFFRPSDRFLA